MLKKVKYIIEYTLKTSPKVLFERISTPSGLSEWFADDVDIKNDVFTFIWQGSSQQAELLTIKPEKYVKFRWLDDTEKNYFEFKIEVLDVTGGVSLYITDFAEEAEIVEAKELWNSSIMELKHALGIL